MTRINMIESETLVPATIKGTHHLGMAVSDLASSLDYYQSVASLGRLGRDSIRGYLRQVARKSAVLKPPNGYIQLMQSTGKTVTTIMVSLPETHTNLLNT